MILIKCQWGITDCDQERDDAQLGEYTARTPKTCVHYPYKGECAMKLGKSLFVNRTELADELGVSVATLRNWSKMEEFPRPLKNSGKVPIFRTNEIINWLEEGEQK